MSNFKVVFFSILGFSIPILGSLYYISSEFSDTHSVRDLTQSDETGSPSLDNVRRAPKLLKVGSGVAFASINSRPEFDAVPGADLLISFLMRFDELPPEGFRQNVITKYEGNKKPYPGWAVGINRRGTSIRPEFYWKDARGAGGWYTFDATSLDAKRWYAVTILVRPRHFISMYVQGVTTPFDSSETDLNNSDVQQVAYRELAIDEAVRYLGGHDVSDVRTPATNAPVLLGATRWGEKGFRGSVALVLVARAETFADSVDSYSRVFDGGPTHIVKRLPEEQVHLWLTESGTDESQHHSEIKMAGRASWQASL